MRIVNISSFSKLFMEWVEPEEVRAVRTAHEKRNVPFWTKPLGVVFIVLSVLTVWFLLELDSSKISLPFMTALFLGYSLGMIILYIFVPICRCLPAKVKIFKDKFGCFQGGGICLYMYKDIENCEIVTVEIDNLVYKVLCVSLLKRRSFMRGVPDKYVSQLLDILRSLDINIKYSEDVIPYSDLFPDSKRGKSLFSRITFFLVVVGWVILAGAFWRYSRINLPSGNPNHVAICIYHEPLNQLERIRKGLAPLPAKVYESSNPKV